MKTLTRSKRESAQALSQVRKLLKVTDSVQIPQDPEFYGRLHEKIMAKMETTEIKPPPARRKLKRYWKEYSMTVMAVLVVFVCSQMPRWWKTCERAVASYQQNALIMETAQNKPGNLSSSVMTYQSESDFFVDVAAQTFDDLSVREFEQILGGGNHTSH